MAKYLLTAIFLGLLITLFYYPTPEIILEEDQPGINNTPSKTELIAPSASLNADQPIVLLDEDPNSQMVILTLK